MRGIIADAPASFAISVAAVQSAISLLARSEGHCGREIAGRLRRTIFDELVQPQDPRGIVS